VGPSRVRVWVYWPAHTPPARVGECALARVPSVAGGWRPEAGGRRPEAGGRGPGAKVEAKVEAKAKVEAVPRAVTPRAAPGPRRSPQLPGAASDPCGPPTTRRLYSHPRGRVRRGLPLTLPREAAAVAASRGVGSLYTPAKPPTLLPPGAGVNLGALNGAARPRRQRRRGR
jgi:hypothetical protein